MTKPTYEQLEQRIVELEEELKQIQAGYSASIEARIQRRVDDALYRAAAHRMGYTDV